MSAILDLQIACENPHIPSAAQMQICLDMVLSAQNLTEQEITVRIVSCEESQQLNGQYRENNKPTNVLSFAFEAPAEIDINLLGDLVICADIVEQEATEQNKPILHHWLHMLVHGTLHLLGLDHIKDEEAKRMEGLEIAILAKLDIDDPYKDH